jgi:hypothetical protein
MQKNVWRSRTDRNRVKRNHPNQMTADDEHETKSRRSNSRGQISSQSHRVECYSAKEWPVNDYRQSNHTHFPAKCPASHEILRLESEPFFVINRNAPRTHWLENFDARQRARFAFATLLMLSSVMMSVQACQGCARSKHPTRLRHLTNLIFQ